VIKDWDGGHLDRRSTATCSGLPGEEERNVCRDGGTVRGWGGNGQPPSEATPRNGGCSAEAAGREQSPTCGPGVAAATSRGTSRCTPDRSHRGVGSQERRAGGDRDDVAGRPRLRVDA